MYNNLYRTNFAIPLYFDKSLSYYEQLCRMYDVINNIISDVSSINETFNVKDEVLNILKNTKIDGDLEVTGNLLISNFVLPHETQVYELDAEIIRCSNIIGNLTGNVTGNVIGNVEGNSSTASKLETPREIKLIGDVVGTTLFDGSENVTLQTTIIGVTTDDISTIDNDLTINGDLRVNGGINATSNIATTGTISASSFTGDLNGKASSSSTADKLTTARTISIIGDAFGSTTFDGSQNVSIAIDVQSSASSTKALKLENARTINLSGDVNGSVSFDGTQNVTMTTTCNNSTHSDMSTSTEAIRYGLVEPSSDLGNDNDVYFLIEG